MLHSMKSSLPAYKAFFKGAAAASPLALAVAPWGILAGSIAVESHLSALQGIGMSVFMFAGAAQLAIISMLNAGAGMLSILVTVALITSRHLLYAMSLRDRFADKPLLWRLTLGFLLTDEFFSLIGAKTKEQFNVWYALGIALSLYLVWNACTVLGVFMGTSIPQLNTLGLDFSIAATFLSIVVPLVRDLSTVLCVFTALITSVLFSYYNIQPALLLSGLSGMTVGFFCRKWKAESV